MWNVVGRSTTTAATLFVSLAACSGQQPDGGPRSLRSTEVTSGGVSDTGGIGSTGGDVKVVSSGGVRIITPGTGGDTSATGGVVETEPRKCGGDTVVPDVIEVDVEVEIRRAAPVAIYVMLDASLSMAALWPGALQSITDFVNDPASAGLDVALSVFPAAPGLDSCSPAAYKPPPIPMGRLPGHAATVTNGLPPFPAGAGTPIEGALRGATEFCRDFVPADPADAGEKCVVLFITDGAPSACAIDQATIVTAAQTAGVPVYTIALPGVPDLTLLNAIATATGTDCDPSGPNAACDLTGGASFSDALNSIRDTIVTIETTVETRVQPLDCEWGLPAPDPVKGFDQDEVNVVLNAPAGATTLANVASVADCADSDNAWHYDVQDDPQRIVACPKACDAIKATSDANVEIQLGCPTVVLE